MTETPTPYLEPEPTPYEDVALEFATDKMADKFYEIEAHLQAHKYELFYRPREESWVVIPPNGDDWLYYLDLKQVFEAEELAKAFTPKPTEPRECRVHISYNASKKRWQYHVWKVTEKEPWTEAGMCIQHHVLQQWQTYLDAMTHANNWKDNNHWTVLKITIDMQP